MKHANKNVMVQLAGPERKYVKVYQDFLDNSFLSTEEQMVFIVLKSYIDFKEDGGEAYPSMETICKRAKMGEKRARKNINALIKKGIVKKVQRGLTKTNLYILADYSPMWDCDNVEDVAAVVQNDGVKPLTPEQHIAELERMGYIVELKEKELGTAEPTKVTAEPNPKTNPSNLYNYITCNSESQELERYSLEEIRQIFDYDAMLDDYPYRQRDIDSVIDILHSAMNTAKPTIRIAGEDKPSMVVIGKLMKLHKESIMYAIDKFSEQTERIKNPASYMLTILYNAPEQFRLDVQNQASHDMAHWNDPEAPEGH